MLHSNKIGAIAIAILAFAVSSCKKDQLPGVNAGLRKLKVYDDTTASAENSSLKMAAGFDKLFMVYGCGVPFAFIGGSIWTLDHQAKVIATNFNGDLVWQNSIDNNLDVYDVVALNDGGCVVVSFNYWGNLNHSLTHIYLNRFDGNGNSILADSVLLPASLSTDYNFWSLGSCLSAAGNIILFGTIYDVNDPVNSVKPFVGEYSFTSGWNWVKSYKLLDVQSEESTIMSAIPIDNGYLFSVVAKEYAPGTSSNAMLFKTNLLGDSLWLYKQSSTTDVWIGNSALTVSGDIYLGYCILTNGRTTGYISRFDQNGQLLNSILIDDQTNNYITSIKAANNGTVTALFNSFGNALSSYNDPIFLITNTSVLRTGAGLNVSSKGKLQSETTDFFPVSCLLPDGSTACFGLIQTKSRTYYKPALIILE